MTGPRCAHCGQALPQGFADELLQLYLPPVQERALKALVDARGAPVHVDRLIWAVYGHRADGGPDAALGAIAGTLHWLRRKLAKTHWRIETVHGFGWRLREVDDDGG